MVYTEEQRQRIGRAVLQKRTRDGLTKEDAAERAGINSITWKRVEDGESVRDSSLGKVLSMLGLEAESFLDGDVEQDASIDPVPEPTTAISMSKLLRYVAHVIDLCTHVRASEPMDRELQEMLIDADELSMSVLMETLAGAERPVPKRFTDTVEALTKYIYGPDPIVDAARVAGRMVRGEIDSETALKLMQPGGEHAGELVRDAKTREATWENWASQPITLTKSNCNTAT